MQVVLIETSITINLWEMFQHNYDDELLNYTQFHDIVTHSPDDDNIC